MRAIVTATLLLLSLPSLASAQEPRTGHAGDFRVDVWTGGMNGSFTFQFTRGAEQLQIGWDVSFQHGQQNLTVPLLDEQMRLGFDAWMRSELAAYLRSPESFRDHALLRLAQLRRTVETVARRNQLAVCDHPNDPDRFQYVATADGEGAFDTCVHRAMNDAEKAELLAALHADLAHRERLVRQNYRAWYAAVRALVPSAPWL